MRYPLAERFHAPQGEGLHSGQQMAFVRTVGCSVGKGTCHACDTDFDRVYEHLGGGKYTPEEILDWAAPCAHVCVTGGEPLDRDLRPLLASAHARGALCHIETSGTVHPKWLDPIAQPRAQGEHAVGMDAGDGKLSWRWMPLWLTVSPKPGWRQEMVDRADEVKVILGGLGDGPGWPTLEDAMRWADAGVLTYVQPRNLRDQVDMEALAGALAAVAGHPKLRLSVQLHKFVRTR